MAELDASSCVVRSPVTRVRSRENRLHRSILTASCTDATGRLADVLRDRLLFGIFYDGDVGGDIQRSFPIYLQEEFDSTGNRVTRIRSVRVDVLDVDWSGAPKSNYALSSKKVLLRKEAFTCRDVNDRLRRNYSNPVEIQPS